MRSRPLHRIIGIVLVLPMLGWALTGFVFFLKPGYGGAYEALTVKSYPMDGAPSIGRGLENQAALHPWLEYRVFRTTLGDHLLVRTAAGWHQLNPITLQPSASPTEDEVRRLVTDAFTTIPQRYGSITRVDNGVIHTDTGIEVTL